MPTFLHVIYITDSLQAVSGKVNLYEKLHSIAWDALLQVKKQCFVIKQIVNQQNAKCALSGSQTLRIITYFFFYLFIVIPDEMVLFILLCFTMVFILFVFVQELLLYCIFAVYYYLIVFLSLGTLPFFHHCWCHICIYVFVIDGIGAILRCRCNTACM